MVFAALTIPAQLSRGLLATVFVLSSLYHGTPCCCTSSDSGETQGNDCCASVDDGCAPVADSEVCCCCQHAPDEDLTVSTCCCSNTPPQSDNRCQGCCHCVEIPVTEGIIATPERIHKRVVGKVWLTDLDPLAGFPVSISCGKLRVADEFLHIPCAHNQRQATLCVWRN